jgi:hypothetical protein
MSDIVYGMEGGYLRIWEEDGFVWIATSSDGRNEFAVCFFPAGIKPIVELIIRKAKLA